MKRSMTTTRRLTPSSRPSSKMGGGEVEEKKSTECKKCKSKAGKENKFITQTWVTTAFVDN